jgi:hypothetical protein
MTSPQPQQQTLSQDALNALYRDLGESKHAVYERNVKILGLQKDLKTVTAERDALKAKYETTDTKAVEPASIGARRNGRATSVIDQAIDAVKDAGG